MLHGAYCPSCHHSITKLCLPNTKLIDNDAIIAVARTCKNLVKLGMSEVEILNSGAVEIGNNLSLLEELRIGRHKLSKVGLHALGNLYSLKSLTICGLGESADVDIQAVLQPSLVSLNLKEALNLTDETMVAIAKTCPFLEYLMLSGCSKVTDGGIIPLAQACPKLFQINLSSTAVTEDGLHAISQHCPQLVSIDLQCCPNITRDSSWMISESHPICEIIHDETIEEYLRMFRQDDPQSDY